MPFFAELIITPHLKGRQLFKQVCILILAAKDHDGTLYEIFLFNYNKI
jgi:hypothetical protein